MKEWLLQLLLCSKHSTICGAFLSAGNKLLGANENERSTARSLCSAVCRVASELARVSLSLTALTAAGSPFSISRPETFVANCWKCCALTTKRPRQNLKRHAFPFGSKPSTGQWWCLGPAGRTGGKVALYPSPQCCGGFPSTTNNSPQQQPGCGQRR